MSDERYGAWIVARLLAGMPAAEVDVASLGEPWGKLARAVASSNGDGRLAAFDAALAGLPNADAIRRAVFVCDPQGTPPGDTTGDGGEPTLDALDALIDDARATQGTDRDEALREIVKQWAELDPFAQVRYRETICKALSLGKREFDRLAKAVCPENEPSETTTWDREPHLFSQTLDYANGIVYTTVNLYTRWTARDESGRQREHVELKPYVVTSNRELLPFQQALDERHLVLPSDEAEFADSRWSKQGIRAFVEEDYAVNPAEVFLEIDAILDYFIEFQETRNGRRMPPAATRHLVALDVMKTYFMPVWSVIGYVHAVGEKGSGKSTLFRVLSKLAFLGEFVTMGTSVAALKRMADMGYTLFFDDVEDIRGRHFDPDKRAILLAGNTRGATVNLMEATPDGRRWKLRRFRAFCPKGYNNITGLDDVLSRRCYTVPMVRSGDRRRTNRDPDASTPPVAYQKAVDDLYTLAMLYMPDVERLYHELEGVDLPLDASDFSIWRSILALARLVDTHVPKSEGDGLFLEMLNLAVAKREERADRGEEGLDVALLRALVRLVLEQGRGDDLDPLTLDDILSDIEDNDPDQVQRKLQERVGADGTKEAVEVWPRWLTTKAGKKLASLNAYERQYKPRKLARRYYFSRERVKALANAHGVSVPSEDGLTPDRQIYAAMADEGAE